MPATSMANLAIRLIQVHMCIVYLFSGIGKLQGEPWVNGTASWVSYAMLEYQSRSHFFDMTWMANWPYLLNFMSHATVFWELSYCALVWPALTRPWVLGMAIFVHLGIALYAWDADFRARDADRKPRVCFPQNRPQILRSVRPPCFTRGRGEGEQGSGRGLVLSLSLLEFAPILRFRPRMWRTQPAAGSSLPCASCVNRSISSRRIVRV